MEKRTAAVCSSENREKKGVKKVLIITYYWPPAGGIGVHRFLKMARYLPEYGWEPIILTTSEGSYPYLDPDLEKDVPSSVKVFRTTPLEPFLWYNWLRGKKGKQVEVAVIGWNSRKTWRQRFSEWIRANFFIPDARVGWYPSAVRKAKEIIRECQPDAIITTGPPHSTHLIGLRLKNKFNIPWIADMRDPWTRIFYNFQLPRTCLTKKIDRYFEQTVLKKADRISVIGPGMKERFKTYPDKTDVVYNGYDEQDFMPNPPQETDGFVIRFVGNMKANDDIPSFWAAFRKLRETDPGFAQQARIIITGRIDPKVMNVIDNEKLQSVIQTEGFVPHAEAVHKMQQAQLLLFSVPVTPDGQLYITGKLFEYIGANCPILGIGPKGGDADQILQISGANALYDYGDENGIYQALEFAYQQWIKQKQIQRNDNNGRRLFTRKKQTEVLAGILNHIS